MSQTAAHPESEAAAGELHDVDRPTGPIAAAVLAVGVGAVTLGFFTTLNEVSDGLNSFLRFDDGVGPLSGKTVLAVSAYAGSWALLYGLWRGREVALRPILIATTGLVVLGLVGTFPTFFEAFAD
jgi:hypothetical protein